MKGGENMKWRWMIVLGLIMTLMFSGCSKEEQKTDTVEGQEQLSAEEESNQSEKQTQMEFEELEPDVGKTGEGTPSYELIEVEELDSYQVGDTISLGINGQVLYELTIDKIAFTDERDEYVQDPGNVIQVTYTYTNLSDSELLIDDMSFQMMLSDESTLLDSYYLPYIQVPEPIEKGTSCTAQVAYSIAEKPDSVILAYHDIVHIEIAPVKITANNL